MTLGTGDNTYSDLGALPLPWRNLIFTSCSATTGDTVDRYHLDANVAEHRVSGSFEVIVQGTGARAGSTLHVTGSFDLIPPPM